jgi:hypothetical protein
VPHYVFLDDNFNEIKIKIPTTRDSNTVISCGNALFGKDFPELRN